jgi:hypothetical protein
MSELQSKCVNDDDNDNNDDNNNDEDNDNFFLLELARHPSLSPSFRLMMTTSSATVAGMEIAAGDPTGAAAATRQKLDQ